jgi:hypothetical protein
MFKIVQQVFEDICARLHNIEKVLGIGVETSESEPVSSAVEESHPVKSRE